MDLLIIINQLIFQQKTKYFITEISIATFAHKFNLNPYFKETTDRWCV